MIRQSPYHSELQCAVRGICYDFATQTGTLATAENNCADMAGAIALFTRIDSNVRTIATIAGGRDDTTYRRRGGEWVAQ
jgi:hypothetical protein